MPKVIMHLDTWIGRTTKILKQCEPLLPKFSDLSDVFKVLCNLLKALCDEMSIKNDDKSSLFKENLNEGKRFLQSTRW